MRIKGLSNFVRSAALGFMLAGAGGCDHNYFPQAEPNSPNEYFGSVARDVREINSDLNSTGRTTRKIRSRLASLRGLTQEIKGNLETLASPQYNPSTIIAQDNSVITSRNPTTYRTPLDYKNPDWNSFKNQSIIPGGHFTWGEATHNGRCRPGENEIKNIIETAKYMEMVRNQFPGRSVHVNSWYRSPEYNKAIGGVNDSQHTKGDAVDFTVSGVSPSEVYRKLDTFAKGGLGKYAWGVHIDTRTLALGEKSPRWDKTQRNYAGLNARTGWGN